MRRFLLWVGRGYQRTFSWILPTRCRFYPSCSQYYLDAIDRHGSARGLWLAALRLLRCHPLARPGYDPVPDLEKNAGA